jgi:glutamyl-tRNA reductase
MLGSGVAPLLICVKGGLRAPRKMGGMSTSEAMRSAELERALRLLQNGRDPSEVIELLSRRLTNKLLHAPTRAVQQP